VTGDVDLANPHETATSVNADVRTVDAEYTRCTLGSPSAIS